MINPTKPVTNAFIKAALREQMRQIPTPQPDRIKSSWQQVARTLERAVSY